MIEIRLRQSWINTFLRCPEQARQDRLGLVSQKETTDFLRGNAVHGAIEYAGRMIMAGLPRPSLDEVLEVAEEFIATYSSEVEVWRQEYEEVVDVVRANLAVWYEELFPSLDPEGVEVPFEREIGRRDNVRLVLTGKSSFSS